MLLLALCVRGWCPVVGAGVSGGVIHDVGTVLGTGPELAAATEGTNWKVGVGCMRMAELEVELELVCAVGVAASDVGPEETADDTDVNVVGAAKEPEIGSPDAAAPGTAKGPTEDDVLMLRAGLAGRPVAKAEVMDCCRVMAGAIGVTGVTFGVVCCDIAVFKVERRMLCCGEILPSCIEPNSPGEKARHEQNPSDEDIRRVSPSVDLYRVRELSVGALIRTMSNP